MEFASLKIINGLATECLQVTLTCSQEEVDVITGLGRLCASLLPCDTHPNFTGLTFHDVVNKRLVIEIPPEYSDKEIEARARRECLQLQDELEYCKTTLREERYDLGNNCTPYITGRAYYGT